MICHPTQETLKQHKRTIGATHSRQTTPNLTAIRPYLSLLHGRLCRGQRQRGVKPPSDVQTHGPAYNLVIAYLYSQIRDLDLILVVSEDRVVERGSHTELMSQEELYQKLYKLQQG